MKAARFRVLTSTYNPHADVWVLVNGVKYHVERVESPTGEESGKESEVWIMSGVASESREAPDGLRIDADQANAPEGGS